MKCFVMYFLMILQVMVKFDRVDCLSHPVCVTFLKMKWYDIWNIYAEL